MMFGGLTDKQDAFIYKYKKPERTRVPPLLTSLVCFWWFCQSTWEINTVDWWMRGEDTLNLTYLIFHQAQTAMCTVWSSVPCWTRQIFLDHVGVRYSFSMLSYLQGTNSEPWTSDVLPSSWNCELNVLSRWCCDDDVMMLWWWCDDMMMLKHKYHIQLLAWRPSQTHAGTTGNTLPH